MQCSPLSQLSQLNQGELLMPQGNQRVENVLTPPIAEVQSWIQNRTFSAERPLLDVAQAVPSYPPAASLQEHLSATVREAETAKYTDILGLPALRRELAAHLSDDYRAHVQADEIAITAGCNQAFCVAVDAIASVGDEIIVPLPYYFNHQMWLDMRGIQARYVAYTQRDPEPDDVERLINSKTKAIALTSPNNPTGQQYSPATIEALFRIAVEHDLVLIIDETYKDFRSQNTPAHELFSQHNWSEHFIHLYSFSKAFAMTGYRVGAIATHPARLSNIEKILDCFAICPSHLSQRAALFALQNLSDWRRQKANMMRDKMQRLAEEFRRNRLAYELVSHGAYFAYVRHPFAEPSQHVAKRLAQTSDVLCLPGSMFGPDQEDYLRFAFANLANEHIYELVSRLIASQ